MTVTNLRPDLTRHLSQRLAAFGEGFRHNLALIGPPGSGKTFQLHQLLARSPGLTLIYCPLYRESCRSFLQRFLSAILQAGLPSLFQAADGQASHPLDALLARAEPILPKTAAAVRQVESLLSRRLHGEAFARALDTIPVLLEERRQPCLLILDEFLFLDELGLGHAFHELGKRVMTWPTTLFILSSSSVHRARIILRERLQLLFGQFELMRLEALDPKQAAAWAQQELRGIRGAKAMAPFLLQWLDGYPWYLTVFLKRLKELAALGKTAELTEPLFLQTAWDLLGSAEGTLHHWCASRMEALAAGRFGARAADALIQIAEGARTTTELGKRVGRGGLSEALELLLEHDAAQRNGTCWIVPDPILRCWLSTILSPQRADARPDGADIRQRFEHHLRALWTRWMQAHQLSFPERIVELFGRFADDTVSLDSKTGRLPKFDAIQTVRPDDAGSDVYLIADGQGKRWCAAVRSEPADERAIASFETFCHAQTPKPSRKVVVMKAGMDQHIRLLAKAANMWVWEPAELHLLMELYGQHA
ncbi:MAG: ATP-binding protein [Candidatus Omnitrophica bacterium]|nr:ATP-binding protein [Candidatus Omnitrophota bacterium]